MDVSDGTGARLAPSSFRTSSFLVVLFEVGLGLGLWQVDLGDLNVVVVVVRRVRANQQSVHSVVLVGRPEWTG